MNHPTSKPFLNFLDEGIQKGDFETDDVLSAFLPLLNQVMAVHDEGLVAPLDGADQLAFTENGSLTFSPADAVPPAKNPSRIEALQSRYSRALEVVGDSRRTRDLDEASDFYSSLTVGNAGDNIDQPIFLLNYRTWEHAVGHHDELTDIHALGLLLASLACGLNFTSSDDLELFAANRTNLFAVHRRINPVIASVIVQMTELNRHKRAPDLGEIIRRLENYREQPEEFDTAFLRVEGFKESPLTGKRRLIQSHLRNRLFEISRRNRLIHFKPTLQSLNLTVASVPLVMDPRNIILEQLFVWHPALASSISSGKSLPLGKYLRFEDAPYIPGVLDKIISEARRDRAEYGFAQLRLVLCFLRWHNLKDTPEERIHSPLLLLPVELKKKKGVRDKYVLEPSSTDAEINPALRHHLKDLYNLDLPEYVDLQSTSLDDLHESLRIQIHSSEPGVTLNKVDRPQIEMIHQRARQRLDQYRRRQRVKDRAARRSSKPSYSYQRENFRPLGLQLFIEKVRPAPLPLRELTDAAPEPYRPHAVAPQDASDSGKVLETERQTYALRDGGGQNPYSWDFDLCSLTLGNFNYRKMTLVRDYANLIETDMASAAFDSVFSLDPRPAEEAPPPEPELDDQHLIVPCDRTQATAIARARTGASYIIQGPPGTGKSQTITNLIADYIACGKRVLFVCEKRAAIDIVFHRLRQQGLDELCCLIHDSQTDKKAFVHNLKQTYESFLSHSGGDDESPKARTTTLRGMKRNLENLRHFSEAMTQAHDTTGTALRELLHRLVELRQKIFNHEARGSEPSADSATSAMGRNGVSLSPEVEDLLPDYPQWQAHGSVIDRLHATLAELGEELCFARHPLRWLGRAVLAADRPLESLSEYLDQAEDLKNRIEKALDSSGLPADLWDTFEEIRTILEFSVQVQPLAERNLLGVLTGDNAGASFDSLAREMDDRQSVLEQARKKSSAWKEPLNPVDTETALNQARAFEQSFLRFIKPAWWKLKKVLKHHYDFSRHAIEPTWVQILEELSAQHAAQAELDAVHSRAESEWQTDDVDRFRSMVDELRRSRSTAHPSVQALLKNLSDTAAAKVLIGKLVEIHETFSELHKTLGAFLIGHEEIDFKELDGLFSSLRGQSNLLVELSPILGELADLPESMSHALRHAPVPLNEFEAAIGHKSLNRVYREDRSLNRFEGRTLLRRMEQLEGLYRDWLSLNAKNIRETVRRQFLEHVNISSLPASQLNAEQKEFKKSYAAGRRELEHEFGKSMRYKSIRDLAAGDTGRVVQDLKPVWLMSPLSVSDTLPLDPGQFDVVIFDEASQIPLEEAIPALYRSHQVIVVGDEMQLPPTAFFSTSRNDEDSLLIEEEGERIEVDLDSDSFLTQSARNLPSTLLAWHYRSRYESLISFSNAAFYGGNLFTIPDRQRRLPDREEIRVENEEEGDNLSDALLARSISFHFMENGLYADRRNPAEAGYIARLVRGLLQRKTGLSIGIVAFSEAQQSEIEDALGRLAREDEAFGELLEAEYEREEEDQFCGLFVKNLENVQGDERDIIIMSVCYGRDPRGRLLMNFGPINQRGGEKRLNVIFSRARQHMAIVSSMRHHEITNDYNDGANSLKNFLLYAEAVSAGNDDQARRVLENLNPLTRKALAPATGEDAVVHHLAAELKSRGYEVEINVGQSRFRCDLAVRRPTDEFHQLGVLVDTHGHYSIPNLMDRYLLQPAVLKAFGWRFSMVLTKDWYHSPDDVLTRLEKLLK